MNIGEHLCQCSLHSCFHGADFILWRSCTSRPMDSHVRHCCTATVVIGHVDSGKSTTTGHLIYKLGGIDKRVIGECTWRRPALGGNNDAVFANFAEHISHHVL